MFVFFVLGFIFFAPTFAQSTFATVNAGVSRAALFPPPSQIPAATAFLGWSDFSERDGNSDPSGFERVALSCVSSQNLVPTHPQSSLKLYHLTLVGTYDHGRMNGNDDACATPQLPGSREGRRYCLRSDILHYHVLSDTYRDACGQTYRGFWSVLFLRRNESMGTLVSKGRTIYEKPNSRFEGDFEDGATYPVPLNEFLFLTRPFNGDLQRIEQERAQALRTRFRFDPDRLIFQPVVR